MWLKSIPMFTSPHIPTSVYTNLDSSEPVPNSVSTRLKSSNPISPQFNAPIIVTTKHAFCNVSIFSPFLTYYLF